MTAENGGLRHLFREQIVTGWEETMKNWRRMITRLMLWSAEQRNQGIGDVRPHRLECAYDK